MATQLKRTLGLVETTFAGVGIILGAGIYALIGKAAGTAGNSVWISFAIAALVAAFTGISYAELSNRFPKDAAEYSYAEEGFNRKIGWIVAWLIIAQGIISTAAVALGFAGYFNAILKDFMSISLVLTAIGVIAVFTFINFWGIKESAWLNIIFTILEAGGLIAIIIFGLNYVGKGPAGTGIDYLSMPNGFPGIMSAAALIFFAFIGFEAIVKLSEETKEPKKTIPKALILSIIISTILYVLVAIASVSILGWEKLGASSAPLADVAAAAFGSNAFLALSIIALFSTANTILIIMLTTSRMMYGIGKDYKKLKWWSAVHKTRKTPWLAVFAVGGVAMLFSLLGDITLVAEITNFSIFVSFIVINAALISVRYKNKNRPTPKGFRAPLNINWFSITAFLGVITSFAMLVSLSLEVLVGGIVLTLIGYGLYFVIQNKGSTARSRH